MVHPGPSQGALLPTWSEGCAGGAGAAAAEQPHGAPVPAASGTTQVVGELSALLIEELC